MYDPCHPIIDNIFFEFTGVTATDQSVIEMQTGDFGRSTIELAVNAICAQGYNGTDCNTFCEEINSVLTCREDEIPTAPSVVNPTSSETICMTQETSTMDEPQSTTSQPATSTDEPRSTMSQPATSTSSQTSSNQGPGDSTTVAVGGLTNQEDSTTVEVGGLTNQESDNTLAIAVGVGIGGAVFLCLLVGLIILLLCLVCRVRRNKQKSK